MIIVMKKSIFVILLMTLCVFCADDAQSQSDRHNWGLGISPGVYSFYALEGGNSIFDGATYGAGVELSMMRYIGKSLDLGLETNFARLAHPADSASAANAAQGQYGFRQNFFTGHLGLRFRFDNGWLMEEDSKFVPFLKLGVGGASYGDFTQWSIYVPVGLGFHIHIPKTPITFTAQSNYNPMFLLPENTTPSGYLHHSIGLSLQLGNRKKKTDNKEFLELAQSDGPKAPDRDYDGVPDEIDQCPDIYGSDKTVGCPDTDEDGIKDTEDKCPEDAGFANLEGCMDSDYDGVIDPEDDCPDVYGENEYGCSGTAGGDDRDGDGVKNEDDTCPDEPGLFTANGCPDADGDGIQDALDMCPEYYGSLEFTGCPMPKEQLDSLQAMYQKMKQEDNFASKGYDITNGGNTITDKFGNDLTIDQEGDIADAKGKKLTTTGDYKLENGEIRDRDGNTVVVGNDGFLYKNGEKVDTEENLYTWAGTNPDPTGFGTGGINIGNYVSDKFPGSADLKGFTDPVRMTPAEEEYCQLLDLSQLRAEIYFEYDAASPNSIRALSRIVEAMRKCAILELQVAGHADSDGSDVYNLELSERRAKAVVRYITGNGISDKRLKFNAYGEKYPIAPNMGDTKSKNRRAEVRVQRAY